MRRTKPEKHEVLPDVRYNSMAVQNMINRIMRRGKKSTATHMVYEALDIVQQRTGRDPIEVLDQALRNVGPIMEVRPRRVGGATYQVPMEVPTSAGWPGHALDHRRCSFSHGKSFPRNCLQN
jgi:small subunit ribosomal protein S7